MPVGSSGRPARWPRRSREPWDDPTPIRSEIFGAERFERHARSLADTHTLTRANPRVVPLLTRLDEDYDALTAAYDAILDDVRARRAITPAAEWIIDNFHVVEAQVRQIRQDLPDDYFRQLPKLGPGFLAGHPRTFALVWAYVAHTDSLVDPDLLARFVRAYEERKPLTLGELWSIAITLRLILVENLRRLADLVVMASADRRYADQVADALLDIEPGHSRSVEEVVRRSAAYEPSRSFAERLLRRLRGRELPEVTAWLTERLRVQGLEPDEVTLLEHQAQAAATVTVRNIFTSLRLISDINWEDWVESVSLIEDQLRTNPGYAALDFPTRNMYRSAIEDLSRGSQQQEVDVARAALIRSEIGADPAERDVGYWLVDEGRRELAVALGYRRTWRRRIQAFARRRGLVGYLGATTLTLAVLVAVVLWVITRVTGGLDRGWLIALGVLAVFGLGDLALGIVNYATARQVRAKALPGLALRDGVPEESRTLVVIPTLLGSPGAVDELVENLEVHYLANSGGEIYFGLVTDWVDAPEPHLPTDEPLLERARVGVRALNARYGDRFLLLHRGRRFSRSENVWMGWERKRGKLEELNRLLRGDRDVDLRVVEGRLPGPFTYVLTLDSDTRLPREAARRLVGKISHPLNRVRLHPSTGRPTRGYGILQPRVAPSLPMSEGSSFVQRVFSTARGLDPYAFAISDVYQDLFGEGSFAGKGIYDIDAVMSTVHGKIPDNTVLSHDLLEGNYARSGLVTDVEVVEEYPLAYEVSVSRTHRWTRGDWQLLPWLLHRGRGLGALGRWKMADNLRRSLTPVALAVGVPITLAHPHVGVAATWLVVVLAALFLPGLIPLAPAMLLRGRGITRRSQVRGLLEDLRDALVLGVVNVTLLAHQAWLMVDAILRTLWRLLVSRRRMLQWTSAAAAAAAAQGTVERYVRLMAGGFVVPVAALVVAATHGWNHLAVAAVPAVGWLAAPLLARWASRPAEVRAASVTDAERDELRAIGRRTWLFFETFVDQTENHLPPDNFQEDPEPVVAHRTSPTNIGLYLLTTVSAADLGWLGVHDALERIAATLRTVGRMETYRGHVLNWVDTRTLVPLEPRYVSSVDSGNLAGHLLALAVACRDWAEVPAEQRLPNGGVAGLQDAVRLLRQTLAHPDSGRIREADRLRVEGRLDRLDDVLADLAATPTDFWWQPVCRQAADLVDDVAQLGASPPAQELQAWAAALSRSAESLRRDEELGPEARARLAELATWCADEALRRFRAMDFGFLFDSRRSLLSVGFHVPSSTLDESCYDLLASEARLASYVAIAKGDIRTRHWFLLGRRVTAVGGGAALQSWSGSMFEYLMPPLVMHAPLDGLLGRTGELVVRRQIDYGAELGVPWGISEAAYNARDIQLTYQYSPFGVPGLGTVRGLADNVVVAPYATGLASMIDPTAATANYARLAELGARGRYGFYESVDFTAERVPSDVGYAVVKCYMAHHQGMTVVAIHNAVSNGRMRERFHREPMVKATELLLQERATRQVPVTHPRREEDATPRSLTAGGTDERVFSGPHALAPAVHFMSNGRLTLTLTPAGGGQLRWLGSAITRWHPDPTSEEAGDHLYLRDDPSGIVWSATPLPILGHSACEVRMADHRVTYHRRQGPYVTDLEYHLSPESDAMVRRLTIRNTRGRTGRLTVCSYAELVLAAARDDDAHPAFSKLFVHTEAVPSLGAVIARRRPRSESDRELWAGHFVVVESGAAGHPAVETDRSAFLGRGRTVRDPAHLHHGHTRAGATGDVLDPIFSLSQRVRVPAHGQVRLDFWTVVAGSRDEVLELIDANASVAGFDRVAMLSWTHSKVQLRHLGLSAEEAGLFQTLAGHLALPTRTLRPAPDTVALGAGPQSALWSLGISGDLPVLVLRIDDLDDMSVVRQLVRAFEYWRLRRFSADLVFLNEQATSYVAELQQALENLATSIRERSGSPDSTGRIYVVRADQVVPATVSALLAGAAVVLHASRGDLAAQVPKPGAVAIRPEPAPELREPVRAIGPARIAQPLVFPNEHGGFSADGSEYVTVVEEGRPTPAPWTNVVANEQFGFLVTAEGAGHTWWQNSRDNQLTPWRNDPVGTPCSEAIYVRDEATGTIASPTFAPLGTGVHTAWHGWGYTAFRHETEEVGLDLVQFVPLEDAVKVSWLKVSNLTDVRREVTVTAYADVVLGNSRHVTAPHLVSWWDAETGALFVRNPWAAQFREQVVALDLAGAQTSGTADRHEFLGAQGTLAAPRALRVGGPLGGRVGAALDPCLALQTRLELEPGETGNVVVLLAAAPDERSLRELLLRHRDQRPVHTLDAVKAAWVQRVGSVQVRTPDRAFDLVMNGWLLYQTLACRMLARCGFYQTSGAYGFRDQLQDNMAGVLVDPARSRAHLLRAAGRQFVEGDVQHWWLPSDGSGIRTRISDDVVWLAYAVARYLRVTDDWSVLDEQVPYLEGRLLADDEHEAFFPPVVSRRTDTLWEHVVSALERSFAFGVHGLPLMGSGDWNDGMNRVGIKGAGESVWLGWFLHATLGEIIPIAQRRGAWGVASRCHEVQTRLATALEEHGWDGAWYRRGYFDDGTPLGSASRPECRIDSIAQSWAVLAGASIDGRAERALAESESQLVLEREGVARLFTPPFQHSLPDPGYVRSYPPGVRENGGQYTHGATWSIFAYAALRREDRAHWLFSLVNPVNHTRSAAEVAVYRGEPYVMAADVYSVAPHVGRAGWTWYTGSSGWMYRAGLEAVLGLRREGDRLVVEPCLPPEWTSVSVEYWHEQVLLDIRIDGPAGMPRRVASIVVDDLELPGATSVPLRLEPGRHTVRVTLALQPPPAAPSRAQSRPLPSASGSSGTAGASGSSGTAGSSGASTQAGASSTMPMPMSD